MTDNKQDKTQQIDNILKLTILQLKARLSVIQKVIDSEPPPGKTKLDMLLEQFSLQDIMADPTKTLNGEKGKHEAKGN